MIRLRLRSAVAAPLVLAVAAPAYAQTMDHSMPGMSMPGMSMPAQTKAKPKPKAKKPVAKKAAPAKAEERTGQAQPHGSTPAAHQGHDTSAMPGMAMPADAEHQQSGHDMQSMPGMTMPVQNPHAGHDMQTMPGMTMGTPQLDETQGGTNLPAGNAPAPLPPQDHAADRVYPPAAMAEAREEFRMEQGGQRFYQLIFNLAEYQVRDGKDGYRWDGEAWWGGDINRLTLKSEGEGAFKEGVESAEIQALYSRAIGPYFNLQGGIRYDFKPNPSRTYLTLGFEGLAPRMFEVEGAAFLSNKGDLLGRLEGYYDQRITQRLILQPRAELNFSAQDVPENRIGAGLVDAELGLRLRYEIRREFAPYIGISYEAKTGKTADVARAAGEDPTSTSFVAGIRFWF
jgi:copper resistance protein B